VETPGATYQIDATWKIIRANDAFCRAFRCSQQGLIGRDVRDLLPREWRRDFRIYVARAMVGVGGCDVTLPMLASCGDQGWFKHTIEPLIDGALLIGYRASVVPRFVDEPAPAKWFWKRGAHAAQATTDFKTGLLVPVN
jgi:PAS domain-containing protein